MWASALALVSALVWGSALALVWGWVSALVWVSALASGLEWLRRPSADRGRGNTPALAGMVDKVGKVGRAERAERAGMAGYTCRLLDEEVR